MSKKCYFCPRKLREPYKPDACVSCISLVKRHLALMKLENLLHGRKLIIDPEEYIRSDFKGCIHIGCYAPAVVKKLCKKHYYQDIVARNRIRKLAVE